MVIPRITATVLLPILALVMIGCAASGKQERSGIQASQRFYSYDIEDKCYYTSQCYSVQIGSAEIDPTWLAPYHAVWTQNVPQVDSWVKTPVTIEEMLTIDSNGQWIRTRFDDFTTVHYPDNTPCLPLPDEDGNTRMYRETLTLTDENTIQWTTQILDAGEWQHFGSNLNGSTLRKIL